MLGQAQTPRRRALPFAAIVLSVLVIPAVGGASSTQRVQALRAHDAAIAAKSRAAVLGLYSLDERLAAANDRLADLHRQTSSLRDERATLDEELRVARTGAQSAQARLGALVRELYEQGPVDPIEIVFGTRNLDDAMTNLDSLDRASGQSRQILRELQAAKVRLVAASQALALREQALAAATREAEATAASLASARTARTAYISSLADQRRLTRHQIAVVVRNAAKAEQRTTVVGTTRVAQSLPAPSSAPEPGARTLTVSATGYSLGGRTATGLPVGWGVAAVDPSVIPLGTHMSVPGYGEAVAADVGGGVSGATVDLWFPTLAQANAWGRRTVTIVLR